MNLGPEDRATASRRMSAKSVSKLCAVSTMLVALALAVVDEGLAQGSCSVFRTWASGQSLTPSDLNSSFTRVGQTNMVATCMDDISATVSAMRDETDPYPARAESLATTLAGELARLRYQFTRIHGGPYWYVDPTPLNPPGDIQLGAANSRADRLVFYHGSSAFYTAFTAGNATASVDYTWPTAGPAATGRFLTSTTGGAMSWAQVATSDLSGTLGVGGGGTGLTSGTSGGVLAFTASGTLASSGALTASALVTGGGAGAAPSVLALGSANQVVGMNSGATANEYKTLTAATGTNLSVSHSANTVTFTVAPVVLGCTVANIVGSGATTYAAPSNCGSSGNAEADQRFPSPIAGTARNLYVNSNSAPGAGETYTITLRLNGANTSVTCTISGAAATTCSDTSNTATVAAADRITFSVVASAGAANLPEMGMSIALTP